MSDNLAIDERLKSVKPGVLSVVSLSKGECEYFLDYMEVLHPTLNISYIYNILGREQFLKFLDVMADTNIKVPTRDRVLKSLSYVKIYAYVKRHNFAEESYSKAAKVFGRRTASVRRIVEKVKRELVKGGRDL